MQDRELYTLAFVGHSEFNETPLKSQKRECEFWRKHAIVYYCYTLSWNFRDKYFAAKMAGPMLACDF